MIFVFNRFHYNKCLYNSCLRKGLGWWATIRGALALVVSLFLLLFCSSVFALNVDLETADDRTVIVGDDTYYLLSPYMNILEDKDGALTIEQVVSSENDRFIKNVLPAPHVEGGDSTYWLEINLSVPDNTDKEYSHSDNKESVWYLEIDKPLLYIAELYVPIEAGGYDVRSADTQLPLESREIVNVNSVFPLVLKKGESMTVYLKLQNRNLSLILSVGLWKPVAFIEKIAEEEFIYGVFFGCMGILMIYNIFIFFSVKDVSYVYYVGFLAGMTLYIVLQYGHGMLFFEDIFDVFGDKTFSIIVLGAYFFAFKFFQLFLDINNLNVWIDRLVNLCVVIVACNVVLSFFISYYTAVDWVTLLSAIILPSVLLIAFYSMTQGNVNGAIFIFGWTPNILGVLLSVMGNYGVPYFAGRDEVFVMLGVVFQALALSFALSNRIKLEREVMLIAEQKKESSLQRYRSIFDNSLEGLYRMTLDGRIVAVNLSFSKIFGFFSAADAILENKKIALTLFRDSPVEYKTLSLGDTVENSFRLTGRDGISRAVEHRSNMIFDDKGSPTHIEGALVDVSEFYEKLRAISEHEKEVLKKDQALSDMKEMNHFLSMMSHYIRTPLTAIVGYSEVLLEDDTKGGAKKSHVDTVVGNSGALLRLINNILDYSKMEANKFTVEKIPLDIMSLISKLAPEFTERSDKRGLTFAVEYLTAMPSEIEGDPMRIFQVLWNLCDNAVKFTRMGAITLEVSWRDATQQLRISVKDTGPGLSKGRMEALFSVFSQRGGAVVGDGCLGLAISKRLADMMGGDILVESQLRQGCTFTLLLDQKLRSDVVWLNASGVPTSIDQPSKRNKTKQNVPTLHGTVLLAEDNIVNQQLISRVLKKTGVTIVVASDGKEACEYCEKSLPDLVLMDINMPNCDGIEAVEYLKDRGVDVPIYALTAESKGSEVDRMLSLGCQGYLSKPVNLTALYQVLETHLTQGKFKK
ncbi:hypothetical protein A9Q81_01835 [Gammaproteobacteria bacterium 42_54_T18]|nr:hypothetical protein A9Q81_01835 [Gammaproteobacteria bacterium 42_54_T18]